MPFAWEGRGILGKPKAAAVERKHAGKPREGRELALSGAGFLAERSG